MQWKALFGLALLTHQAQALLRFSCSQLVIERFDPLLNPGQVSPHLHQIVGGNAFNVTMDPANDLPSLSTCTTCTFSEDFSNYWTAVLYFKHPNGSFHRVKQLPGQYLGNPNGGMTVYYIQQGSGKNTAFTKGFRMIVGDAMVRSMNTSSPEATSLNFRCLDANYGNSGVTGAPGTDSNALPSQKCKGGIRSQIIYPSCWDGKNVDSADHKSHTAYPSGGRCPASHPVQVPSLFIETVWDTTEFNAMWPDGQPQPFVFSMGDPIGVAQHADYMFGWQGDSLQRAMDNCNDFGGSCSTLKTQSVDAINRCTQASRVDETYDGWLSKLPGCNPIQSGPGRAVPQGDCGAPTTYLPGGPSGPAGGSSGGSPAVAPPTTGGSPPSTGGGATPPYTGGTPPATGGGGATVAHYGQCGGNGYTGPTTCASPYTCKKQNDYYSQCV